MESKLSLMVLGSGNAFSQEGRMNSSYILKTATKNILVDCGFTTPLALQKNGIEFNQIDYLLLTHYHGDHFAGLGSFLLGLNYISPQKNKLVIAGPGNVKEKVYELIKVLYAGSEKIFKTLNIEWVSLNPTGDRKQLNDFHLTALQMDHADAALPMAFQIKIEEKVIGFSGDTCWNDNVNELIGGSDYVILESTYTEKVEKGHISVEELQESALVQTKKNSIYLTHLNNASSELANSFGYRCLEDGVIVKF